MFHSYNGRSLLKSSVQWYQMASWIP